MDVAVTWINAPKCASMRASCFSFVVGDDPWTHWQAKWRYFAPGLEMGRSEPFGLTRSAATRESNEPIDSVGKSLSDQTLNSFFLLKELRVKLCERTAAQAVPDREGCRRFVVLLKLKQVCFRWKSRCKGKRARAYSLNFSWDDLLISRASPNILRFSRHFLQTPGL